MHNVKQEIRSLEGGICSRAKFTINKLFL